MWKLTNKPKTTAKWAIKHKNQKILIENQYQNQEADFF